jgi:hypothetical protein
MPILNVTIPTEVSQTITNGVTTKAPSEDAVFDALALKSGVIMTFFPAAQANLNDATTYYFGTNPSSTIQTTAGFGDTIAPVSFTIKSIYGICYQGAGSNENVAFAIGINGVYTNISTTVQLTASIVQVNVTGLSLAVNAGDALTIRMTCPTWVTTNPTNFRASFNVYGE